MFKKFARKRIDNCCSNKTNNNNHNVQRYSFPLKW